MTPDLVTIGWITVDDIVLPDGSYERNVLGGGALYAAVGARIWNERVGIHTVTGATRAGDVRQRIEGAGIDARGVAAIPGNGLELWLLHESENEKQQVPKLASATAEEMDRGRGPLPAAYAAAAGFHIAPQTPQGSFDALAALGAGAVPPVLTLDLLVDAYVDADRYRDLGFLESLTAFLPSREEVHRLWRPPSLVAWAGEQAAAHRCAVVVKMGDEGSLACERDGTTWRVPPYPSAVVDTTGAGDAYCGGFVAGLVAGATISECAAMATVSASYVIEARGALATELPSPASRDARLAQVLEGIRHHA